jgi:hypothetical protein
VLLREERHRAFICARGVPEETNLPFERATKICSRKRAAICKNYAVFWDVCNVHKKYLGTTGKNGMVSIAN